MRTVVALYDDITDARDVVNDLVDAGIARDDVSLIARDVEGEYGRYVGEDYEKGEQVAEAAAGGAAGGAVIGGLAGVLVGLGAFAIPGIGPVVAAGPIVAGLSGAAVGAVAGGLLGALVGWGVPEEEAQYYAEGVRRGGTLVAVRVSEERANDVVEIMEDYDPVDVERRAEYWRSEDDWTSYDPEAEPYDADQIATYRERRSTWEGEYDYDYDEDEETMGVGRGTTGMGPVRVHSATAGGAGMTGTATAGTATTFDDYDQEFRRHYDQSYATSGYGYDQYRPAYRHGYTLATDRRYQDRDWSSVEPEARRRWEESGEGPWEEFKDAVRHGWQRAKRAVS